MPGTASVADVVARWGFFHYGRFASLYREKFGVRPSETLRRAGPAGLRRPTELPRHRTSVDIRPAAHPGRRGDRDPTR
jgi:hypothetical protein